MFSNKPDEWSPKLYMGYGSTILTIIFEGIYVENEGNDGERLMCLLGTAMMPNSNHFDNELETLSGYGYNSNMQLSHVEDDQIMFVLRYPKAISLTTGGISEEMKSLRGKTNATYFDTVHISSRLGPQNKYHFGAEELLLKACYPYPYKDSLIDEDIDMFKEDKFCSNLQRFLSDETFKFSKTKWEDSCS